MMVKYPGLRTNRLLLRELDQADARVVQELAGQIEVAENLLNVPYPYEDGIAESWISTLEEDFEKGRGVVFAIVPEGHDRLVGVIGLKIEGEHSHADLGFWIGRSSWGNGYCTEAARAVLNWGFREVGLNKIIASCYLRNEASANVLRKVGMVKEGERRSHFKHWDLFEDVLEFGILREDHLRGNG